MRIVTILIVGLFLWGMFGLIGCLISLAMALLMAPAFILSGHTPWVNRKREEECIRAAKKGYQWDVF